ncbi:MAG: HTTM domain-containing protein [Pseudomonadota bacterium]
MSIELALRLTEVLLGLALLQHSLEHLAIHPQDKRLFGMRALLAGMLVLGIAPLLVCLALVALSLVLLRRFDGPYNGGADRMSLLILLCLCGAHGAPTPYWQEIALGYLAVQLVLSYAISGGVKLINCDWRNGTALRDVFLFSAYPASEAHRDWARRPRVLFLMAWLIIIFELIFPLALLSQPLLIAALVLAAVFHLANGVLFGLNRFIWAWIASYPSVLWLQNRIEGTVLA